MDLQEYKFIIDNLNISHSEIFKMMKMEAEPPEPMPSILKDIWMQLPEITNINGGYRVFSNPQFSKDDFSVKLNGEKFCLGKTVFHMLKKSESIAVFACTAGEGISTLSKDLMDKGDLLEGYIADTTGSVIVEKAMDTIQENLKNSMLMKDKSITNRYSPGYCDWDVAEQHKLFSFLPENFCGISLTQSALMHSIKSVSGFIGIGSEVKYNGYTCEICTSKTCALRKN